MAIMLAEYTTGEQCSAVCFLGGKKDSMQRIFIKKCFLFAVGGVYSVKMFITGSRTSLKDIRKLRMMLDQVQKWLRQLSKDFYAVGSDTLVKRWDKLCQCWLRICQEINVISRFEYYKFYILYIHL
jgi:hypothetical protein